MVCSWVDQKKKHWWKGHVSVKMQEKSPHLFTWEQEWRNSCPLSNLIPQSSSPGLWDLSQGPSPSTRVIAWQSAIEQSLFPPTYHLFSHRFLSTSLFPKCRDFLLSTWGRNNYGRKDWKFKQMREAAGLIFLPSSGYCNLATLSMPLNQVTVKEKLFQ